MKNCLNCKFEPVWSKWSLGEYSRRTGNCRFKLPKIVLPAVYRIIHAQKIVRYEDNSGTPINCPTWEPKEEKK